jgi:Domain of unknown function (DUF397)
MATPTGTHNSWRKSTYSSGAANCVEVAFGSAVVGVRDSKQPEAGHLAVETTAFRSFVDYIKAG